MRRVHPRFCGPARKLLKKGVVYVLCFDTTLSPTSRLGWSRLGITIGRGRMDRHSGVVGWFEAGAGAAEAGPRSGGCDGFGEVGERPPC